MKKFIALAAFLLGMAHAQKAIAGDLPQFSISHPYVGIEAGLTRFWRDSGGHGADFFKNTGDSVNTGGSIAGICGLDDFIRLTPSLSLRPELEINWTERVGLTTNSFGVNLYRGHIRSEGLLGNLYLDYHVPQTAASAHPLTLFAGAGFGGFRQTLYNLRDNTQHASGSDTDHAWAAGIGAKLGLKPSVSLTTSLRYIDMGEVKFPLIKPGNPTKGLYTLDNKALQGLLGVTYTF